MCYVNFNVRKLIFSRIMLSWLDDRFLLLKALLDVSPLTECGNLGSGPSASQMDSQ